MVKVTIFRSYQDWFKHVFFEREARTNGQVEGWTVARRSGHLVGKWDHIHQRGWAV